MLTRLSLFTYLSSDLVLDSLLCQRCCQTLVQDLPSGDVRLYILPGEW